MAPEKNGPPYFALSFSDLFSRFRKVRKIWGPYADTSDCNVYYELSSSPSGCLSKYPLSAF